MAFTFLQNIAVANYAVALLRMKTELLARGWTIQDSGDGEITNNAANGIYGAGTDVLTVANTAGSYVANNIANFKAWFRMRSPAGIGGPEIVIHHASFNPGSDAFGVIFIPNCAGTGTWAGASCVYMGTPPAGVCAVPWSSTSGGAPPPTGWGNFATDPFTNYGTTAQCLDMAIGDVSEGYAFYAFARTAASRVWKGIFMDYLKAVHPQDVALHVAGFYGGTGGQSNWIASSTQESGQTTWCVLNGVEASGNGNHLMTTEGNPVTEEPSNRFGNQGVCFLSPTSCSNGANDGRDCGLNPYDGTSPEIWRGAHWYWRTSFPENFTGRGASRRPGIKGKSTLFHVGGGGVSDMAIATGQNLIAQGSGRAWIVWDSTVPATDPGGGAITAAVTANVYTYMDDTYPNMTCLPAMDLYSELVIADTDFDPTFISLSPPPAQVRNRVWDSVAGKFITWKTKDPDTTGVFYPGPGSFGVTTSDYVVEADS